MNDILPINPSAQQQIYSEETLTIAAGARETRYTVYDYFRVLSLTGSGLRVIFGVNQNDTPYTGAGVGIKMPNLQTRLELINSSGSPITITYAVALGIINDDRLNVLGSVTVAGTVSTTTSSTLLSANDTIITASIRTAITAANTARRGLVITNIGAASMRVGDSTTTSAARGAFLDVGQSITIETQNAVSGFSTVGTTVSILEY